MEMDMQKRRINQLVFSHYFEQIDIEKILKAEIIRQIGDEAKEPMRYEFNFSRDDKGERGFLVECKATTYIEKGEVSA